MNFAQFLREPSQKHQALVSKKESYIWLQVYSKKTPKKKRIQAMLWKFLHFFLETQ